MAKKALDQSTEEKIKNAARVVFHKKGFSATRTRDIAEEAGLNLALLNYYFRSKDKLFEIIMFETLFGFFQNLSGVITNDSTSLEQKLELIAEKYIDLLTKEPEIPLFILSEIRNNTDEFFNKMPIKNLIIESSFAKQFHQAAKEGKIGDLNPMHFLMNMMSMIVFPFVVSPMLKKIGNMKDADFNELMKERKKLIPIWIKTMMID